MVSARDKVKEQVTETAIQADGSVDFERAMAAWRAERELQQKRLLTDARASFRAMAGWHGVTSQAGWEATVKEASEELNNGSFLIERLGAERYLDPKLMAVLLVLRRRLIDENGGPAVGPAELMMIDTIVLSYFHMLRVNGWIGSFSQWLESEFFGTTTLTAKLKRHYGTDQVRGLTVEDIVQRLTEQLMPLLDRSNRIMLRNLSALRDRRHPPPPPPSVNIGTAGQVNVAQQQVNAAQVSASQ